MQHGLWKLVIRYVLYTYLHRDPVIQMLFRAVVGGVFSACSLRGVLCVASL